VVEGEAEGLDHRRGPLAAAVRHALIAPRARRHLAVGFWGEHGRCGELDAGVEGSVVWMSCECGARTARRSTDDD